MKKKGFTLVELLAVIVILAIITIITVPIIVGKIKKSSFENIAYELGEVLNPFNLNITNYKKTENVVELLYKDEEVEKTEENDNSTTVKSDTLTREELTEIVKQLQEAIKKNKTSEDILNQIYPVGSIYITADIATKEEVGKTLGGTWEVYATGRTLVGVDKENATYDKSNLTGGQSNITLSVDNLPSHNHSLTPLGSISSTFTGKKINTSTVDINHGHDFSATTSSNGNHTHSFSHTVMGWPDTSTSTDAFSGWKTSSWPNIDQVAGTIGGGDHNHTVSGTTGWMKENNSHSHTATAVGTVSSTFKGTEANTANAGSTEAFSTQDPYITVYMYKRVK